MLERSMTRQGFFVLTALADGLIEPDRRKPHLG
jgi:hypothetical protein